MGNIPNQLYLIVENYDSVHRQLTFRVSKTLPKSLKLTTTKKNGSITETNIPIGSVVDEITQQKESIKTLAYNESTNTMTIDNSVNTYYAELTQNTEFIFTDLATNKNCKFELIISNPNNYVITFPSNVVNISIYTSTNISQTKQLLKFVGINVDNTTEWYINC